MAVVSSSFQLIFVLLLVICGLFGQVESNANRRRRQVLDGTVRNAGVQPQKPGETSNNAPQSSPARNRGYYSSPEYQQSPFAGGKPQGWFGTNHPNWVSNRNTEIDKNKPSDLKSGQTSDSLQGKNILNAANSNAGELRLRKIAQQYASKGEKGFKFDQFETMKGQGSVCTNHDNFDGYSFGTFPCPLPPGTGMNQRDQFCCGLKNYQYCCNAEEYSQSMRGPHSDNVFVGDGRRRKQRHPSATRAILSSVIPIVGFLLIVGIAFGLFVYLRKRREQQKNTGKPAGATRLPDTYSVVPQEPAETDETHPNVTQPEQQQTDARA